MKKRLFPFLIGLAALAVSGSAAFYSVFGLSKLFAGASLQVIIMAGSLEFAKLVTASLLYQYWDTINKFLRFYLSIAVFVLMVITSGGIYGFLSGAYQETATKSEFLDKSLAVLQTKQNRFEEQKTDLTLEKTQLNTTISDLRTSLSNPTSVSYWDENSQSFDPLAIAMVIAANFAFAQIRPKEKEVIIEESDKELYTEEDEKRMDIIGQNGNDGIHYDQEEMIKKNEELLATPKIESNPIELTDVVIDKDNKEDIYQEKNVIVKEVIRPETEEERRIRLEQEYKEKKRWGTKN